MLVNIAHAVMYLYLKKVLGAGEEGRCSHSMEMGNREGPPLDCIQCTYILTTSYSKTFYFTLSMNTNPSSSTQSMHVHLKV